MCDARVVAPGSDAPQTRPERPRRLRDCLLLALLLLGGRVGHVPAAPADGITPVPVRAEGIVAYADGPWSVVFLVQGSGTVFVDPLGLPAVPPVGSRLELSGTTAWLRGAPGIAPRSSRQTAGDGTLPTPVTLTTISNATPSPCWASLEGVVHAVSFEAGRGELRLATAGATVRVHVPEPPPPWSRGLVDGRIRVRGVFERAPDGTLDPRLWTPRWSELTVLEPAPAPDTLPVRTVAELRRPVTRADAGHRLRVRVRAVNRISLRRFLVQDDTGQLEAELQQPEYIQQGARLDLAGFLASDPTRVALVDTVSLLIANTGTTTPTREPGLRTLHSVAEIRTLSRTEAARGHPVLVDGVVTYSHAAENHLFVQDGSSGVYVYAAYRDLGVAAGERVRLRGYTGPGDLAPIVVEPEFERLGRAALPEALAVGPTRVLSGRDDCRRVQLTGVFRSAERRGEILAVVLEAEGRRIEARLPLALATSDLESLVDATVRVSAVCGTFSNWRRQLDGVVLFVARPQDVEVLEPPAGGAFDAPLTPVAETLRSGGGLRFGHRVRVSGLVLHQTLDRRVYLRDVTGSLCARLLQPLPTVPGERIEVVGFPEPGRFAPELADAVARIVGRGPAPAAERVSAGQLLGGSHAGDLVSVEARLRDVMPNETGFLLITRSDETPLEALLETETALPLAYESGSRVELRGVAAVREDPGGEGRRARLLLRSPADVRVLEHPSWWTEQRVRWLVGGLAGVLGVSLAWVVTLRRQVRARTADLADRMRHEAEVERRLRAELEQRVEERTRELTELQKRLIREERLAALGKITATVSHELRNPLATIRGSLFLIGEALKDGPARAQKALARAERNLERSNGIIDELLDHARMRPLECSSTDVDAFLRQGLADVTLPSGVELQFALDSGATLRIDAPRLLRCVINLVTNSADAILGASPPATQCGSTIAVGARQQAGRLEIYVEDDGPGVAAGVEEQVFEPFFSTKSKGIGLGLPLVRQIMQQHGGGVTLASRPGATVFTLWLPLEPAPAPGGGEA